MIIFQENAGRYYSRALILIETAGIFKSEGCNNGCAPEYKQETLRWVEDK